jgi:hypothetical protein
MPRAAPKAAPRELNYAGDVGGYVVRYLVLRSVNARTLCDTFSHVHKGGKMLSCRSTEF